MNLIQLCQSNRIQSHSIKLNPKSKISNPQNTALSFAAFHSNGQQFTRSSADWSRQWDQRLIESSRRFERRLERAHGARASSPGAACRFAPNRSAGRPDDDGGRVGARVDPSDRLAHQLAARGGRAPICINEASAARAGALAERRTRARHEERSEQNADHDCDRHFDWKQTGCPHFGRPRARRPPAHLGRHILLKRAARGRGAARKSTPYSWVARRPTVACARRFRLLRARGARSSYSRAIRAQFQFQFAARDSRAGPAHSAARPSFRPRLDSREQI